LGLREKERSMCRERSLPPLKQKARIPPLADSDVQTLFENLIAAIAPPHAVFSEEEAARYLKTTVESVRYYALRKKELAYHTVGKSQVYTKEDLDAFLASRRVMSING
jgi:hypothetical protein